MSSMAQTISIAPARRTMRLYALEAKYEFLKNLRMPAYVVPTLTFPVLFYAFFGLAFGRGASNGSTSMATYLVATYGAFGVIGCSLFGFGVSVAIERGLGWLSVKRATPMPIGAYFVAKLTMSMLFGSIIVLLLSTIGVLFGGVHLAATAWVLLLVTLVLGAIPFCALGLAIGCYANPNSSPAIVNAIYLPMSFMSGLWVPYDFLPGFLKKVATFLPAFHLGQLALHVIGAPTHGSIASHVLALSGFTLLFLTIATVAFRRQQ